MLEEVNKKIDSLKNTIDEVEILLCYLDIIKDFISNDEEKLKIFDNELNRISIEYSYNLEKRIRLNKDIFLIFNDFGIKINEIDSKYFEKISERIYKKLKKD